jgi:hypothetical protein
LTPWVFPIPGCDRFVITSQHPDAIFRRNFGGTAAVRGKKRIEFDLNRPCNQPTSAGSQNFGEWIIDIVFLSERDDAILVQVPSQEWLEIDGSVISALFNKANRR